MPEPISQPAATSRHALPFLYPAQAQKECFVNEAFARIDVLCHPSVIDARGVPPTDPQAGERYLVSAGASGEWSGQDDAIAFYFENGWLFLAPTEGMTLRRIDTGQTAVFSAGWKEISPPADPTGGTTIDVEVRAALAALVTSLRQVGIFPLV